MADWIAGSFDPSRLAKEGSQLSTQLRNETLKSLSLPDAFEDLSGIIRTEVKVIVNALSDRAGERLMLSHRQTRDLKRQLYNRLTQSINETMAPLVVERQ